MQKGTFASAGTRWSLGETAVVFLREQLGFLNALYSSFFL